MICGTAGYVVGLLVFGSLNTLTTKVQFEMESVGLAGIPKHFQKPWFGTLTMFLGMILVLGVHFLVRIFGKKQPKDESAPSFLWASLLIGLPAVLDLIATALCFIGLLYNSASVWQMLRGSMIVFSALLSIVFLGRKMQAHHWAGVIMCCVAVCVVGFANIMGSSASAASHPPALVALGMLLIVLGQVVQAAQVVIEERLLRGYTIAPLHIVGMEGVWGSAAMMFVFLPILGWLPGADEGVAENSADTWAMLRHSTGLQSMVWLYVFSVFTYNISGIMVTYSLSAVHRTMLEASRTAVIWLVDLLIHYYVAPESSFGEVWTGWSWLQLAGFGLLVLGQSVYSDVVRLPFLAYPVKASSESPASQATLETDVSHMKSPSAIIYNVSLPAPDAEPRDEGYVVLSAGDIQ